MRNSKTSNKNKKSPTVANKGGNENMTQQTFTLHAGPAIFGGLTVTRPDTQNIVDNKRSKVILAKGAIPGELVELSVSEENKSHLNAYVSKVIEPSPNRVQPRCKYFGECGGCHYQYASYDKQIELKQAALVDCMQRIANMDTALSDPIVDESKSWGYRYRGRFKVAGLQIGFNRERSNAIVDVEHCPLMTDGINETLTTIRNVVINQPRLLKNVREIQIAQGLDNADPENNAHVHIATSKQAYAADKQFVLIVKWLAQFGINNISFSSIDKPVATYTGNRFITYPLNELNYRVSPIGFFQANWTMNLKLVDTIIGLLDPLKPINILDLYSGAGNFALPMASKVEHITAVEENQYAVQSGLINIANNNIGNVSFINESVEDFDENYLENVDAVIIDPPRSGTTKKVIQKLLDCLPRTIVYISCDPPTLARDLGSLSGSYEIESLRLVDMFPQTYHIESLAVLRAKQ